MDYFEIRTQEIEYSTIPVDCLECKRTAKEGISFDEKTNCGRRKRFYEITKDGTFYLCTSDSGCIGSNRIFKSKIQVVRDVIPLLIENKVKVSEDLNRQNKRIFHNVISLNGHNIQELYALVNDQVLSQKVEYQRTILKNSISNNVDAAVHMFLRIAKNNFAIQTNFNVFNKLSEPNPRMSYRVHKIRRVLLTVFHVFFQDFFDRNIEVNIEESDVEIPIDFESVSVAFYHILDNATKYTLESSILNIKFRDLDEVIWIMFEMDSIEISESEIYLLAKEGYKGENAKKLNSTGDGIGMFIIHQLLTLVKGQLTINPDVKRKHKMFNGVNYCRNQFIIELPKKL